MKFNKKSYYDTCLKYLTGGESLSAVIQVKKMPIQYCKSQFILIGEHSVEV